MEKKPNVTGAARRYGEVHLLVQRIEEAKISAHVRAGKEHTLIPRDCSPPPPRPARLRRLSWRHQGSGKPRFEDEDAGPELSLLKYLNVNTRTSYFARIRNPTENARCGKNRGGESRA
jgi:hypothetical protein